MVTSQLKGTALVVFGKDFPAGRILRRKFNTIVADEKFKKDIEALGSTFVDLSALIDPGSVFEASAFLEKLSHLSIPGGSRLPKSFMYEGYELWWIHYNSLFNYFSFPYTQHKRLLEYLREYKSVSIFNSPYTNLLKSYLEAYGCAVDAIAGPVSMKVLPFGVLVQVIFTAFSLPILILERRKAILFTGDKFEKDKDYDFRLKFIYKELREKNIKFVEFIRSLEPWKTVIEHAIKRRRPVIYSEAVTFAGRFLGFISGGRRRARDKFGIHVIAFEEDPEVRFQFAVATQYLLGVYDDIWAIRIMKWILPAIGIRAALFIVASERNAHTVLGAKLNGIPTVGVLHGVASRYGTPYDFLPGFDGEKLFSVDQYGLWSEWWKDYYIKNSDAYKPEQLYVSGPMRPLEILKKDETVFNPQKGLTRVLFIAEQSAAPREVMPYLRKLLVWPEIKLTIKFRPYRDGFEEWLKENEPGVLRLPHIKVVNGAVHEAIADADVVVGCRGTAVLEALLQLKTPIFIKTNKWGDYYNMTATPETNNFFAQDPDELIEKIKAVRSLPSEYVASLREQYFGDPYKNGSQWAVDRVRELIVLSQVP